MRHCALADFHKTDYAAIDRLGKIHRAVHPRGLGNRWQRIVDAGVSRGIVGQDGISIVERCRVENTLNISEADGTGQP